MTAGIRIPIIADISDLPKSISRAEKELKRLERMFGKLDLRVDGSDVRDMAQAVSVATKNYKSMAQAIQNAKAKAQVLQKTMADLRKDASISTATQRQVGAFSKTGMAQEKLWAAEKARLMISEADSEKQRNAYVKEYNRLKSIALKQLKKEELNQRKIVEFQSRQIKQIVTAGVSKQAVLAKEKQKNLEILMALKEMEIIRKSGRQDSQQKLKHLGLVNRALERQVGDQKELLQVRRALNRETKKERTGGGVSGMLRGRMQWFLLLRVFWEMYRVIGAISEALKDLDEATSRAMRTMKSEVGDSFDVVREKVEGTITQVAVATGAAYKDIGEALYQLSSAGLSAEQAIAGVNTVVTFATVTETSMTDASKLLAGAMNNYGAALGSANSEAEKMAQIGGTLTYVWERNQIDMSEMVQGLNQSINSAQLAGLQFDQLAVIIGNLGTMMIRSGRGGRSLRSAIVQMASKGQEISAAFGTTFDPNKPLAFMSIMGQIHAQFSDMEKTVTVTDKIFKIFGKRGAPAVLAMLKNWEKIRKEIKGIGSPMEIAVNQNLKLLRLQERHRTVAKVAWAEAVKLVADYVNYMKVVRGLLANIIGMFDKMRAVQISAMSVDEIIETGAVQDAGDAFNKLAMAEAKYQKERERISAERKKMGLDEHAFDEGERAKLKIWQDLIWKLQQVKKHYDELALSEKAEIDEAEKSYRAKIDTGAALDAFLKQSGIVKRSRAEVVEALAEETKSLEELKDAWELQYGVHLGKEGMMDNVSAEMKETAQTIKDLKGELKDIDDPKESKGDKAAAKEQAEREKAAEAAAALRLQTQMLEATATEDEMLRVVNVHEAKMTALQAEYDEHLIKTQSKATTDAWYAAKRLEIERATADELKNIHTTGEEGKKAATTNTYSSLTKVAGDTARMEDMNAEEKKKQAMETGKVVMGATADVFLAMAQENKKFFVFYQAMKIGETIMAGAQGVMEAYAQGGPYIGTAFAVLITALTAAKVAMIMKQKPPEYAKGGVIGMNRPFAQGGVTSGSAAHAIIGDNPSGKELVIPSEHIKSNRTDGFVREQGGGGPINIINAVTQDDISRSMAESDSGQNVIVNTIGEDMNNRKTTFKQVKSINKKGSPGAIR